MDCAAGTVPRGLHVLAVRLFTTCSLPTKLRLLISYVIYKETAFCLYRLFLLHQGRIPRHTCRFYCCLAAHQRTRKKDSAEPSFPILWTPPHPPGVIRCGGAYLLPRAYTNLGSLYPVQIAHRQFRIWFGCLVFGLVSFAFQSGCWAWSVRFSLLGG